MILVREFLVFFSVFCFISEVSPSADIAKFFPQISGNLTKVTWAHSINSKSIETILKDGNILMIKVGVDLDKNNTLVVDNSDLSLKDFLEKINISNTPEKIKGGKGKGIKLDFKNITALTDANTSILIEKTTKEKYPLWLNADILKGPGDPKTDPLNSTFLKFAQKFPEVVLSLGWVTTNVSRGYHYEDTDIEAMKKVIVDNKIKNTLTFPVRASLAALSSSQFKSLLQVSNTSTLTIFSGSDDTVDAEKLKQVILNVGVDRVFLDVPQDLEEKLRLDIPKSEASIVAISLLSLALCISAVQILK